MSANFIRLVYTGNLLACLRTIYKYVAWELFFSWSIGVYWREVPSIRFSRFMILVSFAIYILLVRDWESVLQLELVQLEGGHAQILMYFGPIWLGPDSWGPCSCIFLRYLVACALLSYCLRSDIRCIENVILFRQFLCHSAHSMDLYFWFQASLLHLPCVLMSQEVSRTVTSTVHFWDTLWVWRWPSL